MANGNWFMVAVLKSPLHGLLSGSTMVVHYRGRKSGKAYETPVNYYAGEDPKQLVTFSLKSRRWWRNLKGGVAVKLTLRGSDRSATADVVDAPLLVAEGLLAALRKQPKHAQYYAVGLDASGQPLRADVEKTAADRVYVSFRLAG